MEENQVPAKNEAYTVPWSIMDTWLGVGLSAVLTVVLFSVLYMGVIEKRFIQSAGILLIDLALILPIALIFAWRGIHWRHLGFGKFSLRILALGAGLLLASYLIIIPHNVLLDKLGISTQGEEILTAVTNIESPFWFFVFGSLVAPLVEEIFFRGFLFQGLRQKYGWASALLLSSVIFGAAHLDPVAFIPTFILGCVLAYLYHRSNSVWPGVIFHMLINSFGFAVIYVIMQNPDLIPS